MQKLLLNKKAVFPFDRIKIRSGILLALTFGLNSFGQDETHIRKKLEIADGISPKSVVSNEKGIFAAQNMMYRHSVTLYNNQGERLAKIPDEIRLKDYGITNYGNGKYKGAPVEGVFTADGKYLWISNYLTSGENLINPGCDDCIGTDFDPSFLYKINTETYSIENIIEVGSVPKFLAISADQQTLITSNWVSSDISIIDLSNETEIKRVTVGPHPRGIDISSDNKWAFVTIMGSSKIAQINLDTYSVEYITNVGRSPRSLLIADQDSTLYISLNSSNEILKYNRFTKEKTICKTLGGPRSMVLSPTEDWLYVVNYFDDHFTKIATDSMRIMAEVATSAKPIGISANWETSEIWVACYSGKLEIFKDFELEKSTLTHSFFGFELPQMTLSPPLLDEDISADSIIIAKPQDTILLVAALTPKMQPVSQPSKKEYTATPSDSEIPSSCNFHIIIGAFGNPENALKRKKELIEKGYSAQILAGTKLNYVSAKCYSTKDAAELGKKESFEKLKDFGSPWILEHW